VSDEKKAKEPLKTLQWFADLVENLPKPKGDSFASKVVDLESARLVRAAGEVVMGKVAGTEAEPSVERGVSQGLQSAGRAIVEKKLLAEDPISSKVLATLGEVLAEDLKKRLKGGGGLEGEDARELAERRRQDDIAGIVNEMNEKLIKPLAEQVQGLATKIEAKERETGGALSTDEAVEMVISAQDRARKLLEKQGFSVESINVSKEDVKKMLAEEEQKFGERLKTEKEAWEKESGAQVEIEKDRIKATENILTSVVDRVMDMFLAPIKQKIEEAIERGAFKPGA